MPEELKTRKVAQDNLGTFSFFSSGSTILDLALGGGWAYPRIFNIVGDKSTGKTGNAIEAFANFKIAFPVCRMRYAEAEAAFDEGYAEVLGFPPEVTRPDDMLNTVEEFRDDVYKFASESKGVPSLYILDSLDALSDAGEVERFQEKLKGKDVSEGYGAKKAKEMSAMFRQVVRHISKNNCALGIISQVRENIGVTFGSKYTRSGGKALDFYCSQVLTLAEIGKKTQTVRGDTRVIGVDVLGKVTKLKVGRPFREAEYRIIFEYGIDDHISMLEWMKEGKHLADEAYKDIKKKIEKARDAQDYKTLAELHSQLKQDVTSIWIAVEKELTPPVRKYQQIADGVGRG